MTSLLIFLYTIINVRINTYIYSYCHIEIIFPIYLPAELKNESEKKFKEYLAMGRELITKLKVLATLEKASAMEKYEQSHVRKLSYAATEDTASGIGNSLALFTNVTTPRLFRFSLLL